MKVKTRKGEVRERKVLGEGVKISIIASTFATGQPHERTAKLQMSGIGNMHDKDHSQLVW